MLKNRQVIFAKEEVTQGIDPVPTGTDAILCKNIGHSWEGARLYDREVVKNTLGKLKPLFGGTLMAISIEVELKGSAAGGIEPEFDPILGACSWDKTVVPSTSVTYLLISDPASQKSVTIYHYEDGLLYKLLGCRGTVDFNLQVGKPGIMTFNMVGHIDGGKPTDVALASPTYDATVPRVLLSVPFSIDSYSAVISGLSFSPGIELGKPEDISADDGFGNIQIVGRDPAGSFDPLATLVAEYDWIGKWQSDNEGALDTGVVGSVAGNKYQITMPAVSYREVSTADREKVLSREIGMSINESAGDDEISIAFT